jgi:PAS domain S-box-containing protein
MTHIDDDPSREEETKRLLQAAIESANDAIIITELELESPGPRIEYVNPAFTRMTLYTEAEAIGKTPRILQGPKTDQKLLGHLRRDLLTGQFFHGQTINYRKDGTEYVVEWRITPVKNDAGQAVKWLAVQRDVTDRVRAEEALRASENHLRDVNRDLEQFVYSASHDLQEPIRNVAIHSQMIDRKYRSLLPPEGQEHFAYIIEGAKRVGNLVQDLLEYTRASRFGQEDPIDFIDSRKVLQTVIADLDHSIHETGAEIEFGHTPLVRMRELHLRQIFQNLLGNAIKYRRKGVPPRIYVDAAVDNQPGTIRFAVRDNGIGIPAEYHREIFGVFRRLHDRSYEGTGIGLAITQRIVERYGEKVWVESVPGEGSTFYFTTSGSMRSSV